MMMKKWLSFPDFAVLLAGIALTFAFAPYEIFPLAIIAPAVLLASLLKVSPKRAFWLGFVFGLGFFGAGVYWVYISIHDIGQVPVIFAGFITAAFIAILSVFPGLVGYFTNRYFPVNHTTKIVCAFPAIWVLSEWFRSLLFTGFPWLFLGYSQTNSPLKGYAPIFSVYGVSLAVLVTSALVLNAILQYKQKNYRGIYVSLFVLVIMWSLGSALSLIPWTKADKKPVELALVQGNIPQSIKWAPEHVQLSLDTYADLTEPLFGKDKIIIWPEAAVPLALHNAQSFVDAIEEKAQAKGSHMIIGVPIEANEGSYYNSVLVLGDEKRQVYHKRQLVPFGEYTPLSQFFAGFFTFMNVPMSNMIAGKFSQEPLQIGDTKIFTSICYEIAYPELTLFRDKSINLILTVTNDAWFGESNAQAQHLQMAVMRALELGRPLVFVTNDGITAVISPNGKIEASLPQRQAKTLNISVQPMFGMTPWMRNGMDPILFLIICLLAVAVRENIRQARHARDKTTLANVNGNTQTPI